MSERDFTVNCSWRRGVGGETDRKRPQKREHRTHTHTHAHLSTPRLAQAPGGAASGSRLWLRPILPSTSGCPPLSPLLLAGPWHCTTAPRKPNFQVAGQPEGHQLLKVNLPLKITAKSWRNPFSPEVLVLEGCKMSWTLRALELGSLGLNPWSAPKDHPHP